MSIARNITSSNDSAFSFSNLPPQLAFIQETSLLVLAGGTFLILPLIVIVLNVAWQLVSRVLWNEMGRLTTLIAEIIAHPPGSDTAASRVPLVALARLYHFLRR